MTGESLDYVLLVELKKIKDLAYNTATIDRIKEIIELNPELYTGPHKSMSTKHWRKEGREYDMEQIKITNIGLIYLIKCLYIG